MSNNCHDVPTRDDGAGSWDEKDCEWLAVTGRTYARESRRVWSDGACMTEWRASVGCDPPQGSKAK